MITLLTILHVLFCLFLILVILLQTGKGGGMGAAFGGSSSSVFGPRGAGSFIGKVTGIVAAAFMLSSLALAYASSSSNTGVADKAALLDGESESEEVDLDEARQLAEEASDEAEEPEADQPETEEPEADQPEAEEPEADAADAGATAAELPATGETETGEAETAATEAEPAGDADDEDRPVAQ